MNLPTAPEWTGWLALAVLVSAFALLTWWLFFSPITDPPRPAASSTRVLRTRRLLAVLILASGSLGVIGAQWDELWHRMYGGFGDDFLWPPHLLLYASLGMNVVFAGLGLGIALRGRGGIRERFRAEPVMGLLGIIAAYQMASIPVDLLWHEIIGPDISAWSLPHGLLALTISGVHVCGLAIALSTLGERTWRSLLDHPRPMEWVVLGLISMSVLNLLQFGATEWEWSGGSRPLGAAVLARPDWAYPLVTLLIGIAAAHLALYGTARVGAASATALAVLLVHGLTLVIYRTAVPGATLVSHLLLLPPALVLDAWYGLRLRQIGSSATRWGGALIYAGAFLAIAFPYLARVIPSLEMTTADRITTIAIVLPLGCLTAMSFARIAVWLGRVGDPPATASATREPVRRTAYS